MTEKVKIALGEILYVKDVFEQIIKITELGSRTFDFSYDILAGDKNWKHFEMKNLRDPSAHKRKVISILMEGLRAD
jgi:hypothetical protein